MLTMLVRETTASDRAFLPWALLILAGSIVLGLLLAASITGYAFWTGRDEQSIGTPPNLEPLADGPVERVDDRLRNAVVQFNLPADLRPEEMAALYDDGSPTRAIAAALLDLQAKELIRINGPGRGVTVLPAAEHPGDISEFQRRLLRILTRHNGSFEWRDWALNPLYLRAVDQGWFTSRPDYAAYGPKLWSALCFGVGLAGAVYAVQFALGGAFAAGLGVAGPVILLLILGVAFRYAARRRPVRTAKGRALATQLAGFRTVMAATQDGWLRVHPNDAYPGSWRAVATALGVGPESDLKVARLIPLLGASETEQLQAARLRRIAEIKVAKRQRKRAREAGTD